MRALLDRWSLQYRITASVGAGLALILALFGYVAFWAVGQAADQAMHERERLAMLLAHQVAQALDGVAPSSLTDVEDAVAPLLDLPDTPGGGRLVAELIDRSGTVLVASRTGRRPAYLASPTVAARASAEHAALLADLIVARRSGLRPHQPPGAAPVHVVAYAPLVTPPDQGWGITVEQDQDALLAVPRHMRERMLLMGALALLVASALAWLDARRVVRPLRRVTLAAQRIAAGDLTVALSDDAGPAVQGGNEVVRLTVALDTMRRRLVRSLAEIREWNQQLEARVDQRTRELAALGEQRRQLLHKVIWAQEEERKRLARELHDETVQTISGVAMTLQVIEDDLPATQERQRARVAWAREQAVHAAREIRQLILGLRPSALDDLGLLAALRWYANTLFEPLGVVVRFDAPEECPPLPPLVQTAAFRVLQEALANVARHAQARHVGVQVGVHHDALQATVQDDGLGFDAAALGQQVAPPGLLAPHHLTGADPTGRGLGLLGMRERVALLGGTLTLRSAPDCGTTVSFTIPLPPAGAAQSGPSTSSAPPADMQAVPSPAVSR